MRIGQKTLRWALLAGVLAVLNVAVWWRGEAPSPQSPPSPRNGAYLDRDVPSLRTTDLAEREARTIDIHVHAQSVADIDKLLRHMDAYGIDRTCLVASAKITFNSKQHRGFTGYRSNNETVLEAKRRHPGRFCSFVTLRAGESDDVELLSDYVARGADGLKLYTGHTGHTGTEPFHHLPLDAPELEPLFDYADRIQLPITFHVDLVEYGEEFTRVMERLPNLRVNLPHYGLHKNNPERLMRLGGLLDRFPNLYIDTSFGRRDIQIDGFERLAAGREHVRAFIERHADRVMFGSDLVVVHSTSDETIGATLRSYMQLLESRQFRFFLRPKRPMHGLDLTAPTLRAVYRDAAASFLMLDESGALPDRQRRAHHDQDRQAEKK